MSVRWTAGLLALAVALGAWVYFGEIRGDERKKEAEAAGQKIFGVEPGAVTALEFSLADGTTSRVARAGASDWRVESPVAYPADADTVERALHALAKIQSTSTISPAPANLAPFGLGEGRRGLRVFTGAGDPAQIFVGVATPIGGGKYVALGSDPGRIFTVSVADLSGLSPTLVELRDKRLLRIATGGADELTVRAHGELAAHLKKSESGWQLIEPQAAPGDAEKIRRTLDELAMASATEFADAPAKSALDSLAAPELELTLHTPDAEEHLALAHADGKVWLRRGSDPVLLAVSPALQAAIPTRAFDYRAKRVQTLASDKVHALELAYPRTGETHHFELVGSEWRAAETGIELQPLKVEDMLFAVASLDATGIEAAGADRKALGLDPPVVTLRALDDKGAELGVLSLGDASADKGIPATSSQSGELWRISNDVGKEVPLSPEAFANAIVKKPGAPAPPPPAD
ncbi:MAG: DUF4340 domain-containing protein [Myxococcota bacterium]